MKIAAVLGVHANTEIVEDTLDSIRTWVTDKVLVVVDRATWEDWGQYLEIPAYKMSGFYHNVPIASYRNYTLGLMKAYELWPDADWYVHTEYDTLFASNAFKDDLRRFPTAWVLGFDYRDQEFKFPLLESMMKEKINGCYYFIGCCQFYNKEFMQKLASINFFERFLNLTNGLQRRRTDELDVFPGYNGFCLLEHLYPTLAHHYGGELVELANINRRIGNYRRYPVRFRPEVSIRENFAAASIIHPVKTFGELRRYHRDKRNARRNQKPNHLR